MTVSPAISMLILAILINSFGASVSIAQSKDYLDYHLERIEIEELIAESKFVEAAYAYRKFLDSYDFVFLRDYQVSSQLAIYTGQKELGIQYLQKGIQKGWKLKSIRKTTLINQHLSTKDWKALKKFKSKYRGSVPSLRSAVKWMFIKDQVMAMGALFYIGSAAQDRYAEVKFAPHSERQMAKLDAWTDRYGFPGEKLIGTGLRATTILSHHNSISEDYVSRASLYPYMQPKLIAAIQSGNMSPYNFALIDNWYRSVKSGQQDKSYGILDPYLSASQAEQADSLRKELGIRSIALHNGLVDVQEATGMDFYLEGRGWIKGKIQVTE